MHRIRVVNGAVAMLVVVLCLEVRVVFHSFGRYLHAPPPFNYLLVTVTMLGGASIVGAYVIGMVGDAFSSAAFTISLVLVSAAGAVVIGFPILVCSHLYNNIFHLSCNVMELTIVCFSYANNIIKNSYSSMYI